MEDMLGKSKSDLVNEILQLRMECDVRHAHEDALSEQVKSLGGKPVEHTFLNPSWDIGDVAAETSR